MATETRELLSTAEVATLLGVRPQLLVNWRYENRGPAFLRLGRLVRYDRPDVEEWLAESKVAPGSG